MIFAHHVRLYLFRELRTFHKESISDVPVGNRLDLKCRHGKAFPKLS
jgi:hypothetical protein